MTPPPTYPPAPLAPLSTGACTLLAALRAHAHSVLAAQTDRRLAELTGLPQRDLVEYALELLEHGYIVVASCAHPMGRYLVDPVTATDRELDDARIYADKLDKRGVRVLHRARELRRAIEQSEQARRQRADGQLNLDLRPVERPSNAAQWASR